MTQIKTTEVDLSEDAFTWWDSTDLRVDDLHNALSAVSMGNLAPKASTVNHALTETLSGFISAAGIKVRGCPIKITPLRLDVKGVEAVRLTRGETSNEHEHVMSIALDKDDHVRVAKFNSDFVPQVAAIQAKLEEKMTEVFRSQMDYYPAHMVSTCISRVVASFGGVLAKASGGVYFLPSTVTPKFEEFAGKLSMGITINKFAIKPGTTSYSCVVKAIRKEIQDALLEIEEGMKDLGGSMRTNGMQSRLKRLDELKAKVKAYEAILGMAMTDLTDAVDKVSDAVSAFNAMAVCS
jgi:hypothetical protein